MTDSISGDEKFPGLTHDDDCRSCLIARSAPRGGHRVGRTHGKRILAHARRAVRRAVAFLRIMHEAIVAAKLRRLTRELELRGVRYDLRNDTTIRGKLQDDPDQGLSGGGALRKPK
jgi:hypothetical protein